MWFVSCFVVRERDKLNFMNLKIDSFKIPKNSWILGTFKIHKIRIFNPWPWRRVVGLESNRSRIVVVTTRLVEQWHVSLLCIAGRSGLAVACLTAVREVLGSNRAVGSCVYRRNHCDLRPWALPVLTFPAVPRSIQPSALRWTVNVSAFGLSNNNKWRWWLYTIAAYRRIRSLSQVVWSEGRRPLGAVLHSSNEPSELTQWPRSWWHQYKYLPVSQSIDQINSNLAAREPDSKWYAVEIIDKNSKRTNNIYTSLFTIEMVAQFI